MNHRGSILNSLGSVLILASAGCGDGNNIVDPPPESAPEITGISPDFGKYGTMVTITGSNFATTPNGNTVTFNGMEAVVITAGETELMAEVPQGAGSGPVAVTVDDQMANGPSFTYLPDNARFVDVTGSDDGNDCLAQSQPCATIAHAITEADTGDPIYISRGVYTETLTIDRTLSLYGAGQDSLTGTIIQAHPDSGMANSRVIYIPDGNVVSINDLTIRHGHVSGGGESGRGGGIRVVGSTLDLTNVTLEKNRAIYGGGIHNSDASGTYTNVTFRHNLAVEGSANNQGTGGGLYNFRSSPTLEGVSFVHNDADNYGGGVRNTTDSSPRLVDVTFDSNAAQFGGGMYNSGGSSPRLTDVAFIRNSAFNGGGISNVDGSSPTFTNVTFSGNEGSNGGGMHNIASSPELLNVVFAGNTGYGGGMYNGQASSPTLVNVTFIGNAAPVGNGVGGGMLNSSSSPMLVNVSFYGNTAERGGGIWHQGTNVLTLRNTIVWGNHADSDEGHQIYHDVDSPISLDYSLYGDATGDIAGDGEFEATNSLTIDPLFVNAANGDLRLQVGSNAIDAGDPDTDLTLFTTDDGSSPIGAGGNPRVVNGRIDIGAFEHQ